MTSTQIEDSTSVPGPTTVTSTRTVNVEATTYQACTPSNVVGPTTNGSYINDLPQTGQQDWWGPNDEPGDPGNLETPEVGSLIVAMHCTMHRHARTDRHKLTCTVHQSRIAVGFACKTLMVAKQLPR